jgi:di/tricarboxylate transporter
MSEQIVVAALFVALLAGLLLTRWPAAKVFGSVMLACYFFGFVDTDDVLGKAVNPGVVTLSILLMVSFGLEKLNWVRDLSRKLISKSYFLSLLRMCGFTAFTSAVVNNTAVVAMLSHAVRNNKHHPASKLLLPLSYAAILGGTTTLIGTSTNLVVSSFLEDATGQGLAFFDFLTLGLVVTACGLVVILLSSRLLPVRDTSPININQYLIETEVMPDSPLIGKSVIENKLRDLDTLFLVEIVRDNHLISPVSPQELLEAGDKLIFSGDVSNIHSLESFQGLSSFALDEGLLRQNLTEVIVMPGATVEGQTIKVAGFRALFDAAVVGLSRGGKQLSGKLGDIRLQAGDNLMLATGPDFSSRKNLNKNFTVVSEDTSGRISSTENYLITFAIAAAIALATLDIVPLIKGLSVVLAGMLFFGTVGASELRRRFPFDLIAIVISALVIAQSLNNTGLIANIANWLHMYLQGLGPYAAIAGIFLATLVMTEIMTNNAAAALCFPIAFGLSQSFGLNYMPFVMAVAYGASASFLTPFGYTTNLMVQNLGRYAFRDYTRFGCLMTVVYSSLVIYLLPILFPF